MNKTSELPSTTLRRRLPAANGNGLPPKPVEQRQRAPTQLGATAAVESIVIDPPSTKAAKDAPKPSAPTRVLTRAEQLGKRDLWAPRMWYFKTFVLFPIVQHLRFLDFISRVLFPLAYAIFLFSSFAEVGFGSDHYQRLQGSPCYLASLRDAP